MAQFLKLCSILALLLLSTNANWPDTTYKEAYKEDFPTFAAFFNVNSTSIYDWDAFETTTQDGWKLNFFRIRLYTKVLFHMRDPKMENVIFMPGMGQDAETWMNGYFVGHPLPLDLVDDGYTVYMCNNRGTKFSSENTNVADQTSEAYWNFDFTDMAMNDLPAILHSIR